MLIIAKISKVCSDLIFTSSLDLFLKEHFKSSHCNSLRCATIFVKETKLEVEFSEFCLSCALVKCFELLKTELSTNK
jgi:hypothetical protein